MLLVMHSIFITGEVGVIRPDHRVWAIILTRPFEPIDLKKMERYFLSLGLGLRYDIFVVQRYVWYLIFYVVVHRVVFLLNTGMINYL